ncbi:MAG: hypothetical protein PHQ27_11310, partial [Victivallales bacterium]|nr:hypothetical protein [Victivallales bacterium]
MSSLKLFLAVVMVLGGYGQCHAATAPMPETHAAQTTIVSRNGLQLNFNPEGKITAILAGKRNITAAAAISSSGLQLRSMDEPDRDLPLESIIIPKTAGMKQHFKSPGEQLHGELLFLRYEDYFRVTGRIISKAPHDRGVIVTFRLPVDAIGWNWADVVEQSQTIARTGTRYSGGHPFDPRAFLVDGNQENINDRGNPAPFYRQTNSFCSAIWGPDAGLSLAIPRDQFRMVDMAYDVNNQTY